MHHGEHIYKAKCEVAKSNGPAIFGRQQALKMSYVQFPKVEKPVIPTASASIKKTSSFPTVAMAPVIKQTTNHSITINDKTQQLPTTK